MSLDTTALDRWIVTDPDDLVRPGVARQERDYPSPAPCGACDWVGCHAEGCTQDPMQVRG